MEPKMESVFFEKLEKYENPFFFVSKYSLFCFLGGLQKEKKMENHTKWKIPKKIDVTKKKWIFGKKKNGF